MEPTVLIDGAMRRSWSERVAILLDYAAGHLENAIEGRLIFAPSYSLKQPPRRSTCERC